MVVRSLILVGGLSSRMGTPKHALLLPVGPASERVEQPLLVILLLRHHELHSQMENADSAICIAIRDQHQREDVQRLLALHELPQNMHVCYILDDHTVSGPTAGLLAAHLHDHNSSWLVTGCDYPLLSVAALKQLSTSHMTTDPTLTCFINSEGYPEPLLAVWTPKALDVLRDLAIRARSEGHRLGPTHVIRVLQQPQRHADTSLPGVFKVDMIKPFDITWLTNVNTPEEWCELENMLE